MHAREFCDQNKQRFGDVFTNVLFVPDLFYFGLLDKMCALWDIV